MGTWNLGSVASTVLDLVPDVPTAISGTRLLEIADRSREFVQNWTGASIGSNSIGVDYQGPILNMTISETAKLMNLVGGDAESYTLGDLTFRKGSNNNLMLVAQKAEDSANVQLKALGRTAPFRKANG